MQRSPIRNQQPPVWNAPVASASAFMMCSASACMMGGANWEVVLWRRRVYQEAWLRALSQPRKLHVSVKDLPRSWRN